MPTKYTRTGLTKFLLWHTQWGTIDPENGYWGIPHMYAEGVGWA